MLKVERVEASGGPAREVGDPLSQAVVGHEFVALGDEGLALPSKGGVADFNVS